MAAINSAQYIKDSLLKTKGAWPEGEEIKREVTCSGAAWSTAFTHGGGVGILALNNQNSELGLQVAQQLKTLAASAKDQFGSQKRELTTTRPKGPKILSWPP